MSRCLEPKMLTKLHARTCTLGKRPPQNALLVTFPSPWEALYGLLDVQHPESLKKKKNTNNSSILHDNSSSIWLLNLKGIHALKKKKEKKEKLDPYHYYHHHVAASEAHFSTYLSLIDGRLGLEMGREWNEQTS